MNRAKGQTKWRNKGGEEQNALMGGVWGWGANKMHKQGEGTNKTHEQGG